MTRILNFFTRTSAGVLLAGLALVVAACGSTTETISTGSDAAADATNDVTATPEEAAEVPADEPVEPDPVEPTTNSTATESTVDDGYDDPGDIEEPLEGPEEYVSDLDEAIDDGLMDAPEPVEEPLRGENGIVMDSLLGWGLMVDPGVADECISAAADELGRSDAELRESAGFGVIVASCAPTKLSDSLEWTATHLAPGARIDDAATSCLHRNLLNFYLETPFLHAEEALDGGGVPSELIDALEPCGVAETDLGYLLEAI